MPRSTNYAENIYWVVGLILNKESQLSAGMEKLKEYKIGTRPFFYPMHLQPVFQKWGYLKMKNSLLRNI